MIKEIKRAGRRCIERAATYVGAGTLAWLALGAVSHGRLAAVESKERGGVVVKTASGSVQGEMEQGVLVFRGIRFAAPPVGSLRFRPPVPPAHWTEVRPALDFVPACPQVVDIDPTENNNSVMAEDCLAVNVWTPGADAKKRPVMVWIHGGGFYEASARNTWYDGATLARRGDVVVVTCSTAWVHWVSSSFQRSEVRTMLRAGISAFSIKSRRSNGCNRTSGRSAAIRTM